MKKWTLVKNFHRSYVGIAVFFVTLPSPFLPLENPVFSNANDPLVTCTTKTHRVVFAHLALSKAMH